MVAFGQTETYETRGGEIIERYIIPPFSILDSRQGYWQDRRRWWLSLGIESELGRGDTAPGDPSDPEWRRRREAMSAIKIGDFDDKHFSFRRAADARSNVTGAPALPTYADSGMANMAPGTSIFDPVLCEMAYRWWSPPGGSILDPFAGGSVRGIVAAMLGHPYLGIDLSANQVAANREQASKIVPPDRPQPTWIVGDAWDQIPHLPAEGFDMVWTCPPYYDLEVYSDDPADLSNLPTYGAFVIRYREIIERAALCLRPGRFMGMVVSEVRGPGGAYVGLVPDTIRAMTLAGLSYYNEAILVNAAGTLPLRIEKQFGTTRKIGRMHQNVLVAVKGDPERGWSHERVGPPDPQLSLFDVEI